MAVATPRSTHSADSRSGVRPSLSALPLGGLADLPPGSRRTAALGASSATILLGAVLAWLVAGGGAVHATGLVVFLAGHLGLIATLALIDVDRVDATPD